MERINERTRFSTSYRGDHFGQTITTVNGQQYKIYTCKRNSGSLVSTATKVVATKQDSGEYTMFTSTDMFNAITLISTKVSRVTKKAVEEQHYKAIAVFDEKVASGEIKSEKPVVPEIGTILFLDGYDKYQGCHGNNHIVYEVEESLYGMKYHTVEKDTLDLRIQDHVKPWSQKFGIGTYFEPDFKYEGSHPDLMNLVLDAKNKQMEDQKKKEAEQILADITRKNKIFVGKKVVKIPMDAASIIVADLYEDRSDSQTDYFAATSVKRVYLGYSPLLRNNMNELKQAALNFEETKHFPEEVGCQETKPYDRIVEYTSDHHILPNYFLGTEKYWGWKVHKDKYFDLSKEQNQNLLYVAAAEGRYFCPEQTQTNAPITIEGIEIFDYSEKAFAIIGNTRPIKDLLKSLGGSFNFRLTCGPGWIFPKKRLEEVQEVINNYNHE